MSFTTFLINVRGPQDLDLVVEVARHREHAEVLYRAKAAGGVCPLLLSSLIRPDDVTLYTGVW